MQVLVDRWLAWTLRLATEVVLALWLLLMAWVVFLVVQQRMPGQDPVRQGSVYTELSLPANMVEVTSPEVSVFNFEASQARIHYRTTRESSASDVAGAIARVVIGWGIFALILWQVRQVLSSFVRREPLTLENARRFRVISFLLILEVAFRSLVRTLEYLGLEPLFALLPSRGFLGLYVGHLEWTRIFTALLILLLAEALRLGAEHRVDSEAVI